MADPQYQGQQRDRKYLAANVGRQSPRGTDPVVIADLIASTVNLKDDAPLIASAVQGSAGPRGVAAVALSGHRLVTIDDTGIRYYDQATDTPVHPLGLTVSASEAGAAITTAASGIIVEPSWNWLAGRPVFAGPNGTLTQTPPAAGVVRVVGTAVTPTQLYLSIRVGTLRAEN